MKRDYGPPVEGAARVHPSLGAAKSQIHRLRERCASTLLRRNHESMAYIDGAHSGFFKGEETLTDAVISPPRVVWMKQEFRK